MFQFWNLLLFCGLLPATKGRALSPPTPHIIFIGDVSLMREAVTERLIGSLRKANSVQRSYMAAAGQSTAFGGRATSANESLSWHGYEMYRPGPDASRNTGNTGSSYDSGYNLYGPGIPRHTGGRHPPGPGYNKDDTGMHGDSDGRRVYGLGYMIYGPSLHERSSVRTPIDPGYNMYGQDLYGSSDSRRLNGPGYNMYGPGLYGGSNSRPLNGPNYNMYGPSLHEDSDGRPLNGPSYNMYGSGLYGGSDGRPLNDPVYMNGPGQPVGSDHRPLDGPGYNTYGSSIPENSYGMPPYSSAFNTYGIFNPIGGEVKGVDNLNSVGRGSFPIGSFDYLKWGYGRSSGQSGDVLGKVSGGGSRGRLHAVGGANIKGGWSGDLLEDSSDHLVNNVPDGIPIGLVGAVAYTISGGMNDGVLEGKPEYLTNRVLGGGPESMVAGVLGSKSGAFVNGLFDNLPASPVNDVLGDVYGGVDDSGDSKDLVDDLLGRTSGGLANGALDGNSGDQVDPVNDMLGHGDSRDLGYGVLDGGKSVGLFGNGQGGKGNGLFGGQNSEWLGGIFKRGKSVSRLSGREYGRSDLFGEFGGGKGSDLLGSNRRGKGGGLTDGVLGGVGGEYGGYSGGEADTNNGLLGGLLNGGLLGGLLGGGNGGGLLGGLLGGGQGGGLLGGLLGGGKGGLRGGLLSGSKEGRGGSWLDGGKGSGLDVGDKGGKGDGLLDAVNPGGKGGCFRHCTLGGDKDKGLPRDGFFGGTLSGKGGNVDDLPGGLINGGFFGGSKGGKGGGLFGSVLGGGKGGDLYGGAFGGKGDGFPDRATGDGFLGGALASDEGSKGDSFVGGTLSGEGGNGDGLPGGLINGGFLGGKGNSFPGLATGGGAAGGALSSGKDGDGFLDGTLGSKGGNALPGGLTDDGFFDGALGGSKGGGLFGSVLGGGKSDDLHRGAFGDKGDGFPGRVIGSGFLGGALGSGKGGSGDGLPDGGFLGGSKSSKGGGLFGNVLGGDKSAEMYGGGLGGGKGNGLFGGVLGGGKGGGLLGGSVLGSNTGGLLGGLLNGVLGKDGLLKSIVGLGGLAGDLLGDTLGELLSLGGLTSVLGNNGILGTIEGLGIKIVYLDLPVVSVEMVQPVGLKMSLHTKAHITADSLVGDMLDCLVHLNMTVKARLARDEDGTPRLVVEDCDTMLHDLEFKLLHGLLKGLMDTIENLLEAAVPAVVCPLADVLIGLVSAGLSAVNYVAPLGAVGVLHYTVSSLPLIGETSFEIDLNTMVKTATLGLLPVPVIPKAMELPPKEDGTSQLALHHEFLSSTINLLLSGMDLNVYVAEKDGAKLSTSRLSSLIPQIASLQSKPEPMVVKIILSTAPTVAFDDKKPMISISARIEVFKPLFYTPLRSIFAVDANFLLRVWFTAGEHVLKISVSLESLAMENLSSNIGDFELESIKEFIAEMARDGVVARINVMLMDGLALPPLFNLNFATADINLLEDNVCLTIITPRLGQDCHDLERSIPAN